VLWYDVVNSNLLNHQRFGVNGYASESNELQALMKQKLIASRMQWILLAHSRKFNIQSLQGWQNSVVLQKSLPIWA
jgi:DeoR/GlpR family transcriptional regulator of sugar metabolism